MEKSKMSVAILLATYNGSLYLGEQLDSLQRQDCQDFEVFVHDDGSKDSTLGILDGYRARFDGRLHVLNDPESGRGARDSFMWLLEQVESEYYMFCDQDDVWKPSKIRVTLNRMREIEESCPDSPVMIHTDLEIVDESLKQMYPSFWRYGGFEPDLMRRFGYACVSNVFTGCTMMINSRGKDVSIPIHADAPMHDWWIGLCVAKYGHVDNVKEATMLYRQHGDNAASVGKEDEIKVTGAKLFGLMAKYNRYRKMFQSLGYGYLRGFYYKFTYSLHRLGILELKTI